jgi:signal transduction histidine kinase
MLTAKADDSLKVKMLSGKVEDYLTKPFYPEEVKARVKNLVTMKKARQALQKELDSKSEDLSGLVGETLRVKHQLELTNTQLQRINHDLESFVYSASHDLRAPIANLEGFHRQLSKRLQGKADDTGVQILEMMNASILKLKRTISDIAEITRIQKLEEPPQVLLFRQVLQEAGRDIAPMVSESGVQLKLELGVESILYQPTHLRIILYNLLSNAIKFRSPDRILCITIKTWREEEGIGLAVSDNGLGLEAEQISKLFQLFKRLHAHAEGTGIGLYMTRRIVENNQGKIWCESQPGQGSTFQIYFRQ